METAQAKQEMPKVERKMRLGMLQERFDVLESGARERLRKALGAGQHRLTELDEVLSRVTRDDWSVDGLRKRLDLLRTRAEHLRATTMKRVSAMPGTAVAALASGSRVPVQNLARELERLARLIEPPKPKDVEVVAAPEPKPLRTPKAKVEA
ncbi:MAG TPA: hypothetical protein VFG59_02895 [Anaeromyxobacter sp.]|nr:hypothetical protein [Anaeromyxobacter sp.]